MRSMFYFRALVFTRNILLRSLNSIYLFIYFLICLNFGWCVKERKSTKNTETNFWNQIIISVLQYIQMFQSSQLEMSLYCIDFNFLDCNDRNNYADIEIRSLKLASKFRALKIKLKVNRVCVNNIWQCVRFIMFLSIYLLL